MYHPKSEVEPKRIASTVEMRRQMFPVGYQSDLFKESSQISDPNTEEHNHWANQAR
jgi:hypothetical protein